jgi:hypothetical protein
MAERVSGRGKLIVALVALVVVIGAIVFMMTSTDGERSGRQGKLAPDSNEGAYGAGSPTTQRDTPALNAGEGGDIANTVTSDTGRNAPRDPSATPQPAPTGSLTDGPNADPEEAAEPAPRQ